MSRLLSPQRLLAPLAASLLLAGCADVDLMLSADLESADDDMPWRLAAVYDASAVMALEGTPEAELWRPATRMQESCGPAKTPFGLGAMEAEIIGGGLAPVLAILLEARGEQRTLRNHDVRVALGQEQAQFLLAPAVEPRHMRVEIQGDAPQRYLQLVRTQLEMELCLEHKLGRGWQGRDGDSLREAFLLDPPQGGVDRMYFGGQGQPVPALLGPPESCLVQTGFPPGQGGGGAGQLALVPSDVWGASLDWCPGNGDTDPGTPVLDADRIALQLSDPEGRTTSQPHYLWRALDVTVDQEGNRELVSLDYDGTALLERTPLFPAGSPDLEALRPEGLLDLLAAVPHTYPTLGTPDDPDRYTLLLIPNWQLVEGLRRIHADELERPMPYPGADVRDAVGWVLANPELLYIQVPDPELGPESEEWLDLAGVMRSGAGGQRDWGYTVGFMAARSPIAIPGRERPTWQQVRSAHRAEAQAAFLLASGLLAVLLWTGLRRLRDLWTPIPEERIDYWPGVTGAAEAEEDAAEAPSADIGSVEAS